MNNFQGSVQSLQNEQLREGLARCCKYYHDAMLYRKKGMLFTVHSDDRTNDSQ